MSTKFLLGVFDSEEKLLQATEAARGSGAAIRDVYTPYPVHGIDDAMGIRRSRLPLVTFLAGLTGCVLGLGFQIWAMSIDWPINVGGKPYTSIPAYIPVTFELTVLIGGLATVAALFFKAKLFPGAKKPILDVRVTDDRFVLALDAGAQDSALRDLLSKHGAVEVKETEARI